MARKKQRRRRRNRALKDSVKKSIARSRRRRSNPSKRRVNRRRRSNPSYMARVIRRRRRSINPVSGAGLKDLALTVGAGILGFVAAGAAGAGARKLADQFMPANADGSLSIGQKAAKPVGAAAITALAYLFGSKLPIPPSARLGLVVGAAIKTVGSAIDEFAPEGLKSLLSDAGVIDEKVDIKALAGLMNAANGDPMLMNYPVAGNFNPDVTLNANFDPNAELNGGSAFTM